MMKAIRIATLVTFVSMAWVGSVSADALIAEDFEGVATPGLSQMPSGWINSIEDSVGLSGTGSSGTVSVNGDTAGYCRGTDTGGSHASTMIGIEDPFTITAGISCTYRVYLGIVNEPNATPAGLLVGSWADVADGTHATPGGGPFHRPGVVQKCQCDDGDPSSVGPACPTGREQTSNCGLFTSIASFRGRIGNPWGRVLQCEADGWTTTNGDAGQQFEDDFKAAVDKDNSLEIKVELESGGTATGKRASYRAGYAGSLTALPGTDDFGSSPCSLQTSTQVAFQTYAGSILIDDVSVEDSANAGIPVELGGFVID